MAVSEASTRFAASPERSAAATTTPPSPFRLERNRGVQDLDHSIEIDFTGREIRMVYLIFGVLDSADCAMK